MPISENNLINHPFIRKIYQTIEQYGMIRKGDSVLVGVSGGPDSMALLHSLMIISRIMDLRLAMAHLNHCLRQAASDRDQQFVTGVAQTLDIPLFTEKKDIRQERQQSGLSLEEAGREARYRFFDAVCRKHPFQKIAVGHHQDDNAELILLNLLRGSGPAGLSGIPPVRKNIIRPLIGVSHSEILDYLKSQKIDYIIDQSNFDEQFARNKIRHQLMPLLKDTFNPQTPDTINRLGHILRSEEEWISDLLAPFFEKAVCHSDSRKIAFSISELLNLHPAALRRIIRRGILEIKGNLRRITFSHVDSILQLLTPDLSDASLDLPDQIRIIKHAGRLSIIKETKNLRIAGLPAEESKPPEFEYLVSRSDADAQNRIYIHEIKSQIAFTKTDRAQIPDLSAQTNHTAFFDWETIEFPIVIRNLRPGDRFSPMGMSGTQKLKKFFSNNKIEPENRAATPIFTSGNAIIWVGGYRIADPVKVTHKTKSVLCIEISAETPDT